MSPQGGLAEISDPYDLNSSQPLRRSYVTPRHPNVASAVNPEIIQHYHAHVYYDPASSRDRAARLRERVAAAFPGATLGRWHDTPVGPHTQSMYQIAFPPLLLASFLPWLMLNRDGLSILLHPGTGDAYADHIDHAVWLGSVLPLRMNVLRKSRKTPSHTRGRRHRANGARRRRR
jgi:aromatic ring-cleaving dioxygenase